MRLDLRFVGIGMSASSIPIMLTGQDSGGVTFVIGIVLIVLGTILVRGEV